MSCSNESVKDAKEKKKKASKSKYLETDWKVKEIEAARSAYDNSCTTAMLFCMQ